MDESDQKLFAVVFSTEVKIGLAYLLQRGSYGPGFSLLDHLSFVEPEEE